MQTVAMLVGLACVGLVVNGCAGMEVEERRRYRDEAEALFDFGFESYMKHAYPADELKPVSCAGRYREAGNGRGSLDDALGNYSMTLVDSMDTLLVMGKGEAFVEAAQRVVKEVRVDTAVAVSVFESNIRVLGGLLAAHVALQPEDGQASRVDASWYKGELLEMAQYLGDRFAGVFDTRTGLPHSRVNLATGQVPGGDQPLTCTAGAGTLVLEMGMLSRLTGNTTYYALARRALLQLWAMRSPVGLVGNELHVTQGQWVRPEASIGAGIDSFYEYLLKGALLFDDLELMETFAAAYASAEVHLRRDDGWYSKANAVDGSAIHAGTDSLSAFWPGMQVLHGDVAKAVVSHLPYARVWKRYGMLPETFLPPAGDVMGGAMGYPLRPELAESTWLLYAATHDPVYLEVGRWMLDTLANVSRVKCGFASFNNVNTPSNRDDRMDSFVLSETLKYLYLLFDMDVHGRQECGRQGKCLVDMDDVILTTEGHVFPMSEAHVDTEGELGWEEYACEALNQPLQWSDVVEPLVADDEDEDVDDEEEEEDEEAEKRVEEAQDPSGQVVRGRMLELRVGRSGVSLRRLGDLDDSGMVLYLRPKGLGDDGTPSSMALFSKDGRQIVEAEEAMVDTATLRAYDPVNVRVMSGGERSFEGVLAMFGRALEENLPVEGWAAMASPGLACEELENGEALKGRVAVVDRGVCTFQEKARQVEKHGAVAMLVLDNDESNGVLFTPSGDDLEDDVSIAVVMVQHRAGVVVKQLLQEAAERRVSLRLEGQGRRAHLDVSAVQLTLIAQGEPSAYVFSMPVVNKAFDALIGDGVPEESELEDAE